jgi:hypothetical protein
MRRKKNKRKRLVKKAKDRKIFFFLHLWFAEQLNKYEHNEVVLQHIHLISLNIKAIGKIRQKK